MRLGHFPNMRTRKQAAGTARTNFLLRALAGISTPNQGGDPFSGFQAGLAGAMNQGLQAEQAAQAEQEAQLQRDLQERLFDLQERGVAADEVRAQADKARAEQKDPDKLSPYDSETQRFQAELDFLTKHPNARALGVAGVRDRVAKSTEPKPVKDSVSRRNKAVKEKRALAQATADELPEIVDDETLEPETRAAAQKMLRQAEAVSPSQVDQGSLPSFLRPGIDARVRKFREGGYQRPESLEVKY